MGCLTCGAPTAVLDLRDDRDQSQGRPATVVLCTSLICPTNLVDLDDVRPPLAAC